jgi:hypothetical protein
MKDRVKSEGIHMRHCPTAEMLADFLMKPLQGGLFRKFRGVLLGYQHMSTLGELKVSIPDPEERVESGEKFQDSGTHKSYHKQSTGERESETVKKECRTYKKDLGDESCMGPKKHGDLTSNKRILTRSALNRKKK